ncbi:MAG: alginate lyase family protein [Tagaea sp.]|nr:alginate lyase family protein [Tagaea sp.]
MRGVFVAGLIAMATPALASDGLYAGRVVCEASLPSPAFSYSLSLVLRGGKFDLARGTPGRDGYEEMAGTLAPDGRLRIEGAYIADTRKPLKYAGRIDGMKLRAEGPRGPRRCALELERTPESGAVPPFRLPPDPQARRALVGRPAASAFACPRPPAPPRDVVVEQFYRADDPTGSIVDPAAYEARARAVAPLSAMDSGVGRLADRYLGAQPRDPAVAACLAEWLDSWASAGAMLGRVTTQGGFERKWTLAALALAYGALADATEIPAEQRARIETWLADAAWAMVPYYARRPFVEQNNHVNWAALAALAAAAASSDRALFDWGIAAARGALAMVGSDGSLAAELARKSKALHYHKFSIEPLVLAEAIAAANGVALASENGGALARLASFVLAGMDAPQTVAARVGATQEFVGADRIGPAMYAWAEIYQARHPDPALAARLAALRPPGGFAVNWLGGNLTLRWGP